MCSYAGLTKYNNMILNSVLSKFSVLIAIFGLSLTSFARSESYSKFGIIRANISSALEDNQWLVCYDKKSGIENGIISQSEVIGFNIQGDIFRIKGQLRPESNNLLSLASYLKPSILFSTKEGYNYIWNCLEGEKPFEYYMNIEEYEKMLVKFNLYPFFGNSKDTPLSFEILKRNPDFYDHAFTLPRPQSTSHIKTSTTRRLKVGMILDGISVTQCLVSQVIDDYPAAAAGVKKDDIIVKVAMNGKSVNIEKCFPITGMDSIRIMSLKVKRKSNDQKDYFTDLNIFIPSSVESLLFK